MSCIQGSPPPTAYPAAGASSARPYLVTATASLFPLVVPLRAGTRMTCLTPLSAGERSLTFGPLCGPAPVSVVAGPVAGACRLSFATSPFDEGCSGCGDEGLREPRRFVQLRAFRVSYSGCSFGDGRGGHTADSARRES